MARDAATLCEQLREHLVAGEALRAVVPLSAGHSNETYLLDGLDQVLRLPPSETPLLDAHDMLAQFQIFAVLGTLTGGPAVPRVTYFCADESVLGAPFFTMERLSGVPYPDYEVPAWLSGPDDAFRDTLMRNYVGAFANLHRLAPNQVLGRPVTPQRELARWRRFAELAGNEPLVAAFDDLAAREARRSGGSAIVHGDCKAANVLWEGNRPVAILDWEMAYNGEPLADLGYMLFFFPHALHGPQPSFEISGIWNRDQIIAEWEKRSGRSAAGVEWYEALGAGKIAAILSYGHHLALTGQNADARMAAWEPHVRSTTEITAALTEAVR